MPSRDRQLYIRRRLRFEYEQSRGETRPERIECVLTSLTLTTRRRADPNHSTLIMDAWPAWQVPAAAGRDAARDGAGAGGAPGRDLLEPGLPPRLAPGRPPASTERRQRRTQHDTTHERQWRRKHSALWWAQPSISGPCSCRGGTRSRVLNAYTTLGGAGTAARAPRTHMQLHRTSQHA
jgi:hypothetical protein